MTGRRALLLRQLASGLRQRADTGCGGDHTGVALLSVVYSVVNQFLPFAWSLENLVLQKIRKRMHVN